MEAQQAQCGGTGSHAGPGCFCGRGTPDLIDKQRLTPFRKRLRILPFVAVAAWEALAGVAPCGVPGARCQDQLKQGGVACISVLTM